MNKKVNTALFIIGATIGNIIVMILLVIVGLIVLRLALGPHANTQVATGLTLLVFFVAIAGSFFIYHQIVKLVTKHVDMEKYFHPIFRPRKR